MTQFVSSLQFVASSSTGCSESVRQFVAPYIDTGTTTNTQTPYRAAQTPPSSSEKYSNGGTLTCCGGGRFLSPRRKTQLRGQIKRDC